MRLLTYIFYVSSAHWFCEKCEPKATEAVKLDKLVEGECEKCFNYINVRVIKLEKESKVVVVVRSPHQSPRCLTSRESLQVLAADSVGRWSGREEATSIQILKAR